MSININIIENELRKQSIIINKSSLRLNSKQGAVNEVYVVDSNVGKLLIVSGKCSSESEQKRKQLRIFAVSEFLDAHPEIPTADVILHSLDTNGNHFLVQRFVEGQQLSAAKNKLVYLKELAGILAYLHQISVQRTGLIEFKTNKLRGTHKDWFNFLKTKTFQCLNAVYAEKRNQKDEVLTAEKYKIFCKKLNAFFKKYKEYFIGTKGKLLHGDIGFDNVIVNNERISALIDFEWSMSGDPAWDFAGYVDEKGRHSTLYEKLLQEYFKCLKKQDVKIDEANFRFRIKLYWVIKLLFIANTFKKDKNFNWAIQRFEKEIDELV